MLSRHVSSILAAALFLGSAPASTADQKYKGFPRAEALITAQELKQRIDRNDPRLVVLAVVEPMSYVAGHIPRSINVWRPDYEQPVGPSQPIEGLLLERQAFQGFARGLGIAQDAHVVVYDE